MKNIKVNYVILALAFIVGSSGLVALGSFDSSGNPVVILAGSIVGVGYVFLINKWFTGQTIKQRERLNPRAKWPEPRKRNFIIISIIALWFAFLFGAFNVFPAMTQPALGAFSIVGLWLIATYAYNPQIVTSGANFSGETKLDWFAYFFDSVDEDENFKVSDMINEDGSVKPQKLPLEEMQAAWEAEQSSLDKYRAGIRFE